MRILVTGASGFIGSRLVARLRGEGHSVTGTYATGSGSAIQEGIEADLLDRGALAAAVEQVDPEIIFHLAGLSHVGKSWTEIGDYFRVNVLGTEHLLWAAADRRVVFASSAEVYGKVPETEQPLAEDRTPDPRSPYAMSKAASERLVLLQNGIVVRAFNVIGPGQAPNFVLPSFARQVARAVATGGSGLKVGNLEARRDFIHLDDAIEGLVTVALKGETGQIYNIGRGEALSIRNLLDGLLDVADIELNPQMDPDRFRPVDIPLLQANTEKLQELGWQPAHTVREAVQAVWSEAQEAEAN